MPWTRLRQGVFVSVRVNSTESFLAPLITLILKTPTPLKCRSIFATLALICNVRTWHLESPTDCRSHIRNPRTGKTQTRICDKSGPRNPQNTDPILWLDPQRRPHFVAGPKTPARFCGWTQNACPILWLDPKRRPDFVMNRDQDPSQICTSLPPAVCDEPRLRSSQNHDHAGQCAFFSLDGLCWDLYTTTIL